MSKAQPEIAVSIVIPAYNQADLLLRLLDSLSTMTAPPPWEVIVVDDASTDDTVAKTEAWFKTHPAITGHCIRQHPNQGPGAARNRGLAAASGVLVAFTDTDCVVRPQWLAALCAPLLDSPEFVGVGGRVEALRDDDCFSRYNTLNNTLQPITSPDYAIPYLVTCNCAYRREALLAVGGFPTDIPRPGGEDVAASIALYKQGLRFTFAPDAVIAHDYRDTWRRFARTWRNYGFGCGLIAHRMLTPEELTPEWGMWDGENYWGVYAIRPTVTGVRSFFKDMRWHGRRCRDAKIGVTDWPALLLLRAVDRLCYLRGWKAGVRQARRSETL